MTQLKYSVPSVGERNTVAEPKVDVALNEIKTVVNGELDNENLKAGGVAKSNLSAELKAELSSFVGLPLESRKSIVATEQERESAVFGTLATPDEVEVTLPTNGLIAIAYQGTWRGGTSAAIAAIFLGGNQLVIAPTVTGNGPPIVQQATLTTGGWQPLVTISEGLYSLNTPEGEGYTGDVTTGQVVGFTTKGGGPVYVFAAAGTYKISIRFKSATGKVKVKNRKLWAWIVG